ncbi:helix-turn-helix domain-containing protein [Tenacibaculum finnmarkense]|uniref:helix-turn-helix domain-containing protein n=2 Tax=Tenacibaculum finnmarkense TaxID=2781243 RepID=UPI001EFB5587|nr:helix-turn-helix domain-containing protein [Tenacibaculum finnmarkense]MCG8225827.1 AAA family ATPase [Tenacibaculum finnmarkense genomovar finnmarkense]MCG8715661.1 AAA family ATPase [Tenacibaculum finnmarkense]MCG8736479.1 AAA family ATPase [Tenacibaculum finnmarkense]MCG8768006.1 AAA family ATPase [Tenacibaculum finnmarkense]MCG8823552.1 AAA family ATPase [Tenacibaculum finnmarkense]
MIENKELDLAVQFIEKTDRNLFITGKAGTGKTTFLHKIKNESLKRMVIVAPTGVAAINAKGATIHSFFQMPFGPILPNQIENTSTQQRKFNKTKIDIIRSLDLVIIDEISMVRADLLDGIDQVLRKYKNRHKVFGGAQVLMIGDLQQLSPVVRPNDWSILQEHYKSVYFFSSKAFQESNTIAIELKKIYRQKNDAFIKILNEIRNDSLSYDSEKILNERYDPNFQPKKQDGYITLTTHNKRAEAINTLELEKIKKKSFFFKAEVSGKFNENSYPNSDDLELKVGAQVMFIKNDSTPEKRYFNGKIGEIKSIDDDTIYVKCPNDDFEIETKKEIWENISYSIDDQTKEIKEDVAGSFTQIPLRLAWAITIHKSQGLTFEKAIIDAEASFAHGQTYVALSRCTSLEGIVLKTRIGSSSIINDRTVDSFNKNVSQNIPDKTVLDDSEKKYQLNLIAELFDFRPLLYPTTRAIDIFYKNQTSLNGIMISHLETIKDDGIIPLLKIANGFKNQLEVLSKETELAENSTVINDRFAKAITYFKTQTQEFIKKPLSGISFSTDNKAVQKDLETQIYTLKNLLSIKLYCFLKLKDTFKVKDYLQIRADAVLLNTEKPVKKAFVSAKDPALAVSLRMLRDEISKKQNTAPFQIFSQKTLYAICDMLPKTAQELLKVEGMGKVRVQKYGGQILDAVSLYCKKNKLKESVKTVSKTGKLAVKKRTEIKIPTREISYAFFKQGLSAKEIATKRGLTLNTIETHLMSYISSGDIDVLDVIPLKKYKELVQTIEETEFKSLSELRKKTENKFSFSELKMVLLSLKL